MLLDIEAILRNCGYWSNEIPPANALQSLQPFCVDTLDFQQWLQWVFISRLQYMLQENMPLPESCDIAPMAEEWSRSRAVAASDLIRVLKQVDQLLSETIL